MFSLEEASRELSSFGLTGNQARAYIALVKLGIAPVSRIARLSKIRREEIYRMMPKLERLGLVERTLGKPTKYKPISLEEALSVLIKYKQEESERKIAELAEKKVSLLKDLEPLKNKKILAEEEENSHFGLILDRNKTARKLISMTNAAKKEIVLTANSSDIHYGMSQGYDDALRSAVMRGVKVRVLLKIDEINEPVLYFAKEIEPFKDIAEARHVDQLGVHIMVVDNKETAIGTYLDPNKKEVVNLWTDNPSFVRAMKDIFEKQWRESVDLKSRIEYLQTGKPIERTLIFKDPKEAYEKTVELFRSAKKEILVATIPKRTKALLRNYPIKELQERGIAFRLLVPITKENLNEAKELLKYCKLRHLDKINMSVGIADGKHLALVRSPPPYVSSDPEYKEHFKEMWYTNDHRYLEGIIALMEQLWNMGVDGRERIMELDTGKPIERTEVIKGRSAVHESILAVNSRAKVDKFGMFDGSAIELVIREFTSANIELKKRGARVRYITNVTDQNLELVEEMSRQFEVRHSDIVAIGGLFTETEVIFSWIPTKDMPDAAIYSNNAELVRSLWKMAENAWDNAIDAQSRIDEIKRGKPIGRVTKPILEQMLESRKRER